MLIKMEPRFSPGFLFCSKLFLMSSVDLSKVPSFYHNYVNQVTETDLPTVFQMHQARLVSELENIPDDKWDYRYAPGKWTIKELVQHIIDSERIFCYRALRFARKDATELPGFDENLFAENAGADRRTKKDLIDELVTVQRGSALLFSSLDDTQLKQSGVANGKPVYVEAIGYIIAGHTLHHLAILKERYLN